MLTSPTRMSWTASSQVQILLLLLLLAGARGGEDLQGGPRPVVRGPQLEDVRGGGGEAARRLRGDPEVTWVERFDRRGTEPFELSRSEFD